MKYFTREELDDIASELLLNPTYETLKKLSEKYNKNIVEEVKEETVNEASPLMTDINTIVPEQKESTDIYSPKISEVQMPQAIPNINVQNMEIPKNNNVTELSSFELPKLETPIYNNQNNEPVAFSGNLWNIQKPEVSNLMQTTDNFSSEQKIMPSTEVPVTSAPFFTSNTTPINNPIPVNSVSVQGPTMFGEMQQNYM